MSYPSCCYPPPLQTLALYSEGEAWEYFLERSEAKAILHLLCELDKDDLPDFLKDLDPLSGTFVAVQAIHLSEGLTEVVAKNMRYFFTWIIKTNFSADMPPELWTIDIWTQTGVKTVKLEDVLDTPIYDLPHYKVGGMRRHNWGSHFCAVLASAAGVQGG